MALNEEQLAAVNHPQGEAALLLAGAGSGKTTALTARIVHLITKDEIPPRRILVLTFTNKAAGEIRGRVLKATGLTEDDAPRLTTIHSLALSIIRQDPTGFGFGSKITPLDDYDAVALLKKILFRKKIEESNPIKLKEQINFHRARGVGFEVDYTEDVHEAALQAYNGYHALTEEDRMLWRLLEAEKLSAHLVDFADMLALVNRRAAQDPNWLVKLQRQFSHVLMDEAQDTSVVSWTFVNNFLGPTNRNLCCVGDVSQSIFSFNGSCPQLILDFAKEWRGSAPALYRLQRNHRSVPEVVSLANDIQAQMIDTLPLQMESYRGSQGERGRACVIHGATPQDVSRTIAKVISKETSEGRGSFRDFAILVRTSMQVREIEGELVRARIPYVVRGGRGLLQTEEVRDVLSYIRLATNPKDLTALSRAISTPKRGLGDVAVETLRKIANAKHGGDLVAAAGTSEKFIGFANVIKQIQTATGDPLQALKYTLALTNYEEHVKSKYGKEKERVTTKLENLGKLREMITSLVEDHELTTEDLIFQLTMEKADEDDETGAVTISTGHSAKGLEWKTVFVFSVVEGCLPHQRSLSSNAEIEEERRLFYVTVTRARDTCVICIPEMVQHGDQMRRARPSRFLTELGIA